MAAIRARFYVAEFRKYPVSEGKLQAEVTMNAVTRKSGEDNIDWAKYSPAGKFSIHVSQEAGGAFDTFEALLGTDVAILITPIEDQG